MSEDDDGRVKGDVVRFPQSRVSPASSGYVNLS